MEIAKNTASCTIGLNAMKSLCKVQEGKSQSHGKAGCWGEGRAGLSEDIVFELHLKQRAGTGHAGKGEVEEGFRALGRSEAKASIHDISRALHSYLLLSNKGRTTLVA